MKKLFKALYEWMERKWPDQVIVTLKDYKDLNDRIAKLEAALPVERLKTIEAEINKFNISLGFGGTIDRTQRQPFQR